MLDLTFAEQVKIILSRKGMTIKELAEIIEERTGKKMSRQNLTQRLGRDNFQEQDMRMIADILGCPFQLSILADSEAMDRAANVGDVEPSEKELAKLKRAKERKARRALEAEKFAAAVEQVPREELVTIEGEAQAAEKEMTIGDYIDMHEELIRQETGEIMPEEGAIERATGEIPLEIAAMEVSPQTAATRNMPNPGEVEEALREKEEEVQPENVVHTGSTGPISGQEIVEALMRELAEQGMVPEDAGGGSQEGVTDEVADALRELEELEREEAAHRMERAAQQPEEKRVTGWRSMFSRRSRKERQEELREEKRIESEITGTTNHASDTIESDYIEYEEPLPESAQEEVPELISEPLYEEEAVQVYDEDAEDLTRGERNPYTGHEYETNSVRMHPKRIGYVQVYDRRDHAWTDMTEWAFLGYQERKKALLGKDYEPPIYLD